MVLGLALACGAAADERSGGQLPFSGYVHADPAMVQQPFGRPSLVGVAVYPVSLDSEPRDTVMDCSTDARQEGELTVPYACVVLPQWPSSGTPWSIEDGYRRRFAGQ